MKKILIFLTLILLIAGGAFLFLTSDMLNTLVKEQMETIGSKVTAQKVTVEKVDLRLLDGAGTINGLVLNNPKGYSKTPLFSLNEITLNIDINSLTSDPIILDAIVINKPEALVEFNKNGRANIQEILDAIKKNIPQSSATANSTVKTEGAANETRIRVKKFILAGVALRVDLTELGNTKHKKTLPDIELSNIGGAAGLPANELGAELLKQALSSIWKSAKKDQQKILENKAKDKAKKELSKFLNKL